MKFIRKTYGYDAVNLALISNIYLHPKHMAIYFCTTTEDGGSVWQYETLEEAKKAFEELMIIVNEGVKDGLRKKST